MQILYALNKKVNFIAIQVVQQGVHIWTKNVFLQDEYASKHKSQETIERL